MREDGLLSYPPELFPETTVPYEAIAEYCESVTESRSRTSNFLDVVGVELIGCLIELCFELIFNL